MSHEPTTTERTRPRLRLVPAAPDHGMVGGKPERSPSIDAGAEALRAIDCMSRRIDDLARAFNLPSPRDPIDRPPRAA